LRFFGDRGTLVVGPAHAPETTAMTRSVRLPAANMSSGSTRGSLPGTSMSRPDALGRNAVSSIRGGGGDGDGHEPGDWIPPNSFDEYRLVRLLGRGSMGSVYLAHDDSCSTAPSPSSSSATSRPDAEDRERFLVEARAVARIQHPNVMAVYRVGELEGRTPT
jgi:serine/threonine protein kinase